VSVGRGVGENQILDHPAHMRLVTKRRRRTQGEKSRNKTRLVIICFFGSCVLYFVFIVWVFAFSSLSAQFLPGFAAQRVKYWKPPKTNAKNENTVIAIALRIASAAFGRTPVCVRLCVCAFERRFIKIFILSFNTLSAALPCGRLASPVSRFGPGSEKPNNSNWTTRVGECERAVKDLIRKITKANGCLASEKLVLTYVHMCV